MVLEVNALSCGYDKGLVVRDLSLTVSEGEILCILGPNGVGKTTLFKAMMGHLATESGSVKISGKYIKNLSVKELARLVSYVPQAHNPPFPF